MMRAVTVQPGSAGSLALDDVPEPPESDGPVLVSSLALGVCGTDLEIAAGEYGWAPPARRRLILGHESLGRVIEAPESSGLVAGDLVVPTVRRPDPVPCVNCAADEADMCRNGLYTERGIKQRDGFASQRYRVGPANLVRIDPGLDEVGVLVEPASVVAKAWDHIDHIGGRATWDPRTVLITGAGPVGLLAALLAAQRGLEVHVVDLVADGPKPALVRALGAEYHLSLDPAAIPRPDIVLECTGASRLVLDVMTRTAAGAVVCLLGVSAPGRKLPVDAGALNRELVLENDVVFGSVSASRSHYERAAEALRSTDRQWLRSMITRRVPLDDWPRAYARRDNDVKVVIDFT